MLIRLAGLACIAAVLVPQIPTPAAATPEAPARTLTVQAVTIPLTADAYGDPGTLVPVVLRLERATATTTAELELATEGVHARCADAPRFDQARHTLSRQCYVRMPAHQSHLRLQGYARVLTPGDQPAART
jgi:hypothetical protein